MTLRERLVMLYAIIGAVYFVVTVVVSFLNPLGPVKLNGRSVDMALRWSMLTGLFGQAVFWWVSIALNIAHGKDVVRDGELSVESEADTIVTVDLSGEGASFTSEPSSVPYHSIFLRAQARSEACGKLPIVAVVQVDAVRYEHILLAAFQGGALVRDVELIVRALKRFRGRKPE